MDDLNAAFEKRAREIANYSQDVESRNELQSQIAIQLALAYQEGALAMLDDVNHSFAINGPSAGWWSRVRMLLRIKYDS